MTSYYKKNGTFCIISLSLFVFVRVVALEMFFGDINVYTRISRCVVFCLFVSKSNYGSLINQCVYNRIKRFFVAEFKVSLHNFDFVFIFILQQQQQFTKMIIINKKYVFCV